MRHSLWRKGCAIYLWVGYFIIIFVVSNVFLSVYMDAREIWVVQEPPAADWEALPQLCNDIESISEFQDTVTIKYTNPIETKNTTLIGLHFALVTKWLQQEIVYPLGGGEVKSLDTKSVTLRFHLPVVGSYNATLFCLATPGIEGSEHLARHAVRHFPVKLAIEDLDENNREYTQLRCHYEDDFARRWCEARNLPYFHGHFFFFSPARFQFPEPFIVPGARAPPFDIEEDRLVFEPIPIPFKASTVQVNLEEVTDVSYVTGVFHNVQMLWHAIFDFLIPFYHFLKLTNGNETRETRRIYIRSNGMWLPHRLLRAFSSYPIVTLSESNPSMLLRTAFVGMEKLETNPNPNRSYDESIRFTYAFDRSTALGMREEVLEYHMIPPNQIEENHRPLVLIIDRGSGTRNLPNFPELVRSIEALCPRCEVIPVKFQNMEIVEQVSLVARASILIGFHGSGLTHVVWMREWRPHVTTHLIEILPYNFTCREWYHTAANVSGVHYHSVMNRHPPEYVPQRDAAALKECWADPSICGTLQCHDLLRDQPTLLEIDTFNETFRAVLDEFKFDVDDTD